MNSFDDDVSVLSVHSFSDDDDDNDDGLESAEQNNLPFVYETPQETLNAPSSGPHPLMPTTFRNLCKRCIPRIFLFGCCRRTTNKTHGDLDEKGIPDAATIAMANPTTPSEIKERITAESKRVDAIKQLLESHQYNAALIALREDTPEDLHYFNRIKGEAQGIRHFEKFNDHKKKHGRLFDFEDRPAPIDEPTFCIWSGYNDFGHPLRCHNQCLKQPINQLGKTRSKPLHFCVYHTQYCLNTASHSIPMKIRTPNDQALCNECYIQRNGHPPVALLRIPGTRRKRG